MNRHVGCVACIVLAGLGACASPRRAARERHVPPERIGQGPQVDVGTFDVNDPHPNDYPEAWIWRSVRPEYQDWETWAILDKPGLDSLVLPSETTAPGPDGLTWSIHYDYKEDYSYVPQSGPVVYDPADDRVVLAFLSDIVNWYTLNRPALGVTVDDFSVVKLRQDAPAGDPGAPPGILARGRFRVFDEAQSTLLAAAWVWDPEPDEQRERWRLRDMDLDPMHPCWIRPGENYTDVYVRFVWDAPAGQVWDFDQWAIGEAQLTQQTVTLHDVWEYMYVEPPVLE